MATYEMIMLDDEDDVVNGELTWDQMNGTWNFKTNDDEVAEVLRKVGSEGAHLLQSHQTEDSIYELLEPIEVTDDRFLVAVKDMLLFTDFLYFREVSQ